MSPPAQRPSATAMSIAQFISSVGFSSGVGVAGGTVPPLPPASLQVAAAAPASGVSGAQAPPPPPVEGRKKGRGRKRKEPPEGPLDEPTRAQARLVKNRASAARSRERKLAYTSELEDQVATLRAENDLLRTALQQAGLPLPTLPSTT